GPPVNLAARLAELAGPDEVLVDAEAHGPPLDHGHAIREVLPRGLPTSRRTYAFPVPVRNPTR
ncbi:MAG: hypothetical protein JWM31_1612, partial [Solirubrobacterales bacterium]|nr:hypothetical protein [Solirubrobacterales bacterium]